MGGNRPRRIVSLQHLLEGKELQRANFIVIDPRLTRTRTRHGLRARSTGHHIPTIYGCSGTSSERLEDKEFIAQRVYGRTTSARGREVAA